MYGTCGFHTSRHANIIIIIIIIIIVCGYKNVQNALLDWISGAVVWCD
jgi:hypothetical protein